MQVHVYSYPQTKPEANTGNKNHDTILGQVEHEYTSLTVILQNGQTIKENLAKITDEVNDR